MVKSLRKPTNVSLRLLAFACISELIQETGTGKIACMFSIKEGFEQKDKNEK